MALLYVARPAHNGFEDRELIMALLYVARSAHNGFEDRELVMALPCVARSAHMGSEDREPRMVELFTGSNCFDIGMLPEQAGVGPDGFPEPIVPPMRQLATDVPIQPSLLGNLCLQQLNLWMGNSLEGSPCANSLPR